MAITPYKVFKRIKTTKKVINKLSDIHAEQKIKNYIKNNETHLAVQYVKDRAQTNAKFRNDIYKVLNMDSNIALTMYHYELFINKLK